MPLWHYFCIENVCKTVPFWKVAPKRCPKRYCFTDDQTVPQGHHFGATYFFECALMPISHGKRMQQCHMLPLSAVQVILQNSEKHPLPYIVIVYKPAWFVVTECSKHEHVFFTSAGGCLNTCKREPLAVLLKFGLRSGHMIIFL